MTAWFEEGIAEYFGAGLLKNNGRTIVLGVPDRYRMSTFKDMLIGKTNAVIPPERFINMKGAELTGQYYAQSWAFTHYLLEGLPTGRLIIFEYQRSRKGKFSYQYLTELQSHLKDFDFLKS